MEEFMYRVRLLVFFVTAIGVFSTNTLAEDANTNTSKKLDQIVESQKKILGQLEEIKKELYVVKIRATR